MKRSLLTLLLGVFVSQSRFIAQTNHAPLFACLIFLIVSCAHNTPTAEEYAAAQRSLDERFNDARAGNVDWAFFNDLRFLTDQNVIAESYKEALYTLEPLAKFTEIIYGANSLEYAKIQMELFEMYGNLEKYSMSERVARRALAIYEAHPGATPTQLIRSRNLLGYILHAQERYDEADQILEKSVRDCEKELPEFSRDAEIASPSFFVYCDQADRFRRGERWID